MPYSPLARPVDTAGHGPATGTAPFTSTLRGIAAAAVAAILGVTAAGAAQADVVYNTIDGTTPATAIDAEAELMPLAFEGAPGTTTLRVQARNAATDGVDGCNLAQGPVTFSIQSSDTAVATVEPATVEFTACTTLNGPVQEKLLTVTPLAAGSATVTATILSNASAGTFNTQPATFRVAVAAPSNNPPSVAVAGVTSGMHYVKGQVPTPMCETTDAEDGTTTFSPAMSRPLPHDPDGLGERVAKCTYTDSGGSTAVSSASYFVFDGNAPTIRPVLSRPIPASGWYRTEVAMDWAVVEPQSPGSLSTEGCERVWVTAEQPATTYTCVATSAGGRSEVTSQPIGLDSTPPTVTGTIETPSVDVDGVTWYGAIPSIRWEAADALSGVREGSIRPTVTIDGEGRNRMARTVATDVAGNTGGTAVRHLNIDTSAPVVAAQVTGEPAYHDGTRAWFKDSATVDVTASDPEVQPSESGSGLKDDPTGVHVVTSTSDFTTTATDNVGNTGTSNTVPVAVDAAAPAVSVKCPSVPIIKGLPVKATWTAKDEPTGSGLRSAATGTVKVDTSSVGSKTLTAPVATDNVGHTSAPATCGYRVVYGFLGFLAPIDNHGVYNKVKAGSAVPVKFSLLGNQGMKILSGAPVVTKVTCPAGMKVDGLEETASSSSTSGLKYDSKTGIYNYTWKTATSFAGTCQKLTVKLADGTSKTALFTFTR